MRQDVAIAGRRRKSREVPVANGTGDSLLAGAVRSKEILAGFGLPVLCASLLFRLVGGDVLLAQNNVWASNLEQAGVRCYSLGPRASGGFELGQSFGTGSRTQDYVVGSVELRLCGTDAGTGELGEAPPTVTLHAGSPTGQELAEFTGPSRVPEGMIDNYVFRAPPNVRLSPNQTYAIVAKGGGFHVGWMYTSSSSEDAATAAGWSIADESITSPIWPRVSPPKHSGRC